MAIEDSLDGLFVGIDVTIEMVVYTSAALTTVQDITNWTIVLDIRKKDTSSDPPMLTKSGNISGVFNANPVQNTQKVSWALTDDDLSVGVFPNDDSEYRYSIKRTNPGGEAILRFGFATIKRATQV